MSLAQTLRRTSALAAATLILGLGAAAAIANPPGISDREAAILRAQYHEIKHLQRVARADGEVTRREHARIQYQQQKLRHMIHRARNN
jgi:hypothetical protein